MQNKHATRAPISHSQRAALRQYYQSTNPKPTHAALRAWFKSRFGHEISQSIVSRSLSSNFVWFDVSVPSVSEYRIRKCQWPWLEILLTTWLCEVETTHGQVSNADIRRKAMQFWKQSEESQGLKTPSFSTGWVIKFRQRHNIRLQPYQAQYGTTKDTPNTSSFVTPISSLEDLFLHQSSSDSSSSSESVVNVRSTSTARLEYDVNETKELVFSSDHLIHLVQHNSYHALMSNKSLMRSAAIFLKEPEVAMPIRQYPTRICGGLTVIRPLIHKHIPESLYPIELQMNCAHTGWIDMFPFPRFRHNLIARGSSFVPEEMIRDLFGDIFPDYKSTKPRSDEEFIQYSREAPSPALSDTEDPDVSLDDLDDGDDYTAGRKELIIWGDPWNVQNWEVTPGFVKKWAWAFKGCDDLISASNKWRAIRNEQPMITRNM